MINEKEFKQLVSRVEKLEKVLLREPKTKDLGTNEKFSGASGGVRLLHSNGFFDQRRKLADVRTEMRKHGYDYSLQAVDAALARASKPGHILTTFREGGGKLYAKRK